MHHALITKKMASKCGKELKQHIETPINKPPICGECHTGKAHVSRKKSLEVILKHHSEKEVEEFFKRADELAVTVFKRILF